MSRVKKPKLLDEVREVMRLRHDSIHTERSYSDWIKWFVYFQQMKSRKDIDQKNIFLSNKISSHFPLQILEKNQIILNQREPFFFVTQNILLVLMSLSLARKKYMATALIIPGKIRGDKKSRKQTASQGGPWRQAHPRQAPIALHPGQP